MLLTETAFQWLTLDILGCNAAVSSCAKGKQWLASLALLLPMAHYFLIPNALSYSAIGGRRVCGCPSWAWSPLYALSGPQTMPRLRDRLVGPPLP